MLPSFPLAATTRMPAARAAASAFRIISIPGSESHGQAAVMASVPKLMLITRIGTPKAFWFSMTQSTPAIQSETNPMFWLFSTFTGTIRAAGATPVPMVVPRPRPAMIPDTLEPCP